VSFLQKENFNCLCLTCGSTTGWRRCIGCLIFVGHFPQKRPIISVCCVWTNIWRRCFRACWPPCAPSLTLTYTHTHTHTHMHMHTHTHTHTHTLTNMYTHTYKHTHTHKHTQHGKIYLQSASASWCVGWVPLSLLPAYSSLWYPLLLLEAPACLLSVLSLRTHVYKHIHTHAHKRPHTHA